MFSTVQVKVMNRNSLEALLLPKAVSCTTVGGLGSEGDKTVIPGPKYRNPSPRQSA